jgi:hypothetical protein
MDSHSPKGANVAYIARLINLERIIPEGHQRKKQPLLLPFFFKPKQY